jgi:hypothetical protein
LDKTQHARVCNAIQNISSIIKLFYKSKGWPKLASLMEHLHTTEPEPVFITPHFLCNLGDIPNDIICSVVRRIFNDQAAARMTTPVCYQRITKTGNSYCHELNIFVIITKLT